MSSQRGDTIVEVMIVLAVLGLAISISYATANKSLLATRAAQESAQATVLLKNQIENLRVLAAAGYASPVYTQAGNDFCIKQSAPPAPATVALVSGGTCRGLGAQGIYTVNISHNHALNPDLFTAVATWEDVSGRKPDDSATLVYKTP